MKKVISLSFLSLFLFLQSCSDKHEKFSQTYISALSIGDLAEVTVDTNKLVFSFRVLEGDLKGTKEESGNGTLKPIPGFRHAYYINGNKSQVAVVIKDEVAIGVLTDRAKFYVGVPEVKQKVALKDVAGIYNYVSYSPNNRAQTTSYGTCLIKSDKTWVLLHQGDLAAKPNEETLKGEIRETDNGVLELWAAGQKVANVMIRPEKNGEHFAAIDLVTPQLKGLAFASKQAQVSGEQFQGSYKVLITGEEPVQATLQGNELKAADHTYHVQYNSPWLGLVRGKTPLVSATPGVLDRGKEFLGITSKRSNVFYGLVHEVYQIGNDSSRLLAQAFIGFKD